MGRRPRSLSRARRRGQALYVGPTAGTPPRYLPTIHELGEPLGPGRVHEVYVLHEH